MRLVPAIDVLNDLPPDGFAEALRPLFETAPSLAQSLYARRPYAAYEQLIDTAEALARKMSFEQQVEVLSAHPRIGAPAETLSAASRREQGARAGDAASVDAELARLNEDYERKFGFRFVVFVNRRPRSEVLEVLGERLQRPREEELRTGLQEMFRIARDRYSASA